MKKENYKKSKVEFYFSPFFWAIIVFMFVVGYFDKYMLAYICMVLHELGHVFAALILKKRIKKIRFLIIGINASIEMEESNLKERILILFSGPLTNLILFIIAVILFILNGLESKNIYFLIILNLYLMIFNLFPIIPLDGGEILKIILRNNLGLFLGSTYLRKISFCLSIVLIIVGLILMANNFYNFSLVLIGIYTLINLKLNNSEAAFMNMKLIMYRRARLLKRGIYGARDLVALKSVRLGEILKSLDYDRFHFIYVLDENLKLLKVFSEQELIDGMLKYNTEITLEELIEKNDSVERLF